MQSSFTVLILGAWVSLVHSYYEDARTICNGPHYCRKGSSHYASSRKKRMIGQFRDQTVTWEGVPTGCVCLLTMLGYPTQWILTWDDHFRLCTAYNGFTVTGRTNPMIKLCRWCARIREGTTWPGITGRITLEIKKQDWLFWYIHRSKGPRYNSYESGSVLNPSNFLRYLETIIYTFYLWPRINHIAGCPIRDPVILASSHFFSVYCLHKVPRLDGPCP